MILMMLLLDDPLLKYSVDLKNITSTQEGVKNVGLDQ